MGKDWMRLEDEIEYDKIDNLMAINSGNDNVITPQSFIHLKDRFGGNASVFFRVYQDLNHYLVSSDNWSNGKWKISQKISADIINYLNEINGYLDDMNEWILSNNSNKTTSNEKKAVLIKKSSSSQSTSAIVY